jgi:hypothetical protein
MGSVPVFRRYVEIEEGKFLMDDVPSERRSRLRRVLQDYRRGKVPG